MKKFLMIVSMVSCMSANALQLPQLTSIGMSQVTVPSGIVSARNGDKHDWSNKYKSSVPTFNLSGSSSHLVDNKTLVRMKYTASTGHYSESLTVSPSISPSFEVVRELSEDMFLMVNFDLPTIGKITEKPVIDKHKAKFSANTARSWADYTNGADWGGVNPVAFNNRSRVNVKLQWKFHAPWGSK